MQKSNSCQTKLLCKEAGNAEGIGLSTECKQKQKLL
jgi:hypothetical protein